MFDFRYARRRALLKRSPRYGMPPRLVYKTSRTPRPADAYAKAFRDTYVRQVRQVLDAASVRAVCQAARRRDSKNLATIIPTYSRRRADDGGSGWKALDTALRQQYAAIVAAAGRASLAPFKARKVHKAPTLEATLRFDIDNPHCQQWINEHCGALITAISQDTLSNIRNIVRQGFGSDGITVDQMAAMIKPLIGLSPRDATAAMNRYQAMIAAGMDPASAAAATADYAEDLIAARAETIARTETIAAEAQGTREGWRQAIQAGVLDPDSQREWIASPESDDPNAPCAICIELDGQRKGLDEPFESSYVGEVDIPPAHPRCLPGDQLVLASDGISAASKRWYQGDLVVIRTARGHELACTPNHPILTPCGMVAASLLHIGSDVFSHVRRDRMAVGHDEHQHVPTRIKDVARALGDDATTLAVPVPTAAHHFHGDGVDGQIAVVYAKGLLRHDPQASAAQQVQQALFRRRRALVAAGLIGLGRLEQLLTAGWLAAHGVMGGGAQGLALGGRRLCHAHAHALRAVAGHDPLLTQAVGHRRPRQTEALGDGLDRLATDVRRRHGHVVGGDEAATRPHAGLAQQPLDRHVRAPQALADCLDGQPGQIQPDRVVSVDVVAFAAHVYNLETGPGAYLAGGIAVSNCRCTTEIAGTPQATGEDDD